MQLTIDDITKDQKRSEKKQIAEVRVIHQQIRRKGNESSGSSWLFGGWLNLMFAGSPSNEAKEGNSSSADGSLSQNFESLDASIPTTILKV